MDDIRGILVAPPASFTVDVTPSRVIPAINSPSPFAVPSRCPRPQSGSIAPRPLSLERHIVIEVEAKVVALQGDALLRTGLRPVQPLSLLLPRGVSSRRRDDILDGQPPLLQ